MNIAIVYSQLPLYPSGDTMLIVAAENGYSELCRILVDDPRFRLHYSRNVDGMNALLAAARRGYVGVCEFFLGHPLFRSELQTVDNHGYNAFLYAAASFRFAEDCFFASSAGWRAGSPARCTVCCCHRTVPLHASCRLQCPVRSLNSHVLGREECPVLLRTHLLRSVVIHGWTHTVLTEYYSKKKVCSVFRTETRFCMLRTFFCTMLRRPQVRFYVFMLRTYFFCMLRTFFCMLRRPQLRFYVFMLRPVLRYNAFLYAAASFRFAEDLERVFFRELGGMAGGRGPGAGAAVGGGLMGEQGVGGQLPTQQQGAARVQQGAATIGIGGTIGGATAPGGAGAERTAGFVAPAPNPPVLGGLGGAMLAGTVPSSRPGGESSLDQTSTIGGSQLSALHEHGVGGSSSDPRADFSPAQNQPFDETERNNELSTLLFPLEFYRARTLEGRDALHLASSDGALHICRFLLRKKVLGFGKHTRDNYGQTPHMLLSSMMEKNRWEKNHLYVDFLRELQLPDESSGNGVGVGSSKDTYDRDYYGPHLPEHYEDLNYTENYTRGPARGGQEHRGGKSSFSPLHEDGVNIFCD